MSRKQVSIRGSSYRRVKEYCDQKEIPVAVFIDKLCTDYLAGLNGKKYSNLVIDFRRFLF